VSKKIPVVYIPLTKGLIPTNLVSDSSLEVTNEGAFYFSDTPVNRVKFKNICPLGFRVEKNRYNISIQPAGSTTRLEKSLSKSQYKKLKNGLVECSGGRCLICGTGETNEKVLSLSCTWDYNEYEFKKTLTGVTPTCHDCAIVFDLSLATTLESETRALKRLARLEKLSEHECQLRASELFDTASHRRSMNWTVDLSFLGLHS
jgi:hypothetical protein